MEIVRFVGHKQFLELGDAASDSGFYGAHGDSEDIGDFFVGAFLEIEEGDGRLIDLIDLRQGLNDAGGIELVDAGGGDGGQFAIDLLEFVMGETSLASATFQELAMQCRK